MLSFIPTVAIADYQALLKRHHQRGSMSAKGNYPIMHAWKYLPLTEGGMGPR
ncbi:hypothetical protein NI175_002117 [Salmonella enterica]|uniref:hypothetical protein n=1 Tax=Salmonella enterica TaxID=28901 RepID=UPI0015C49140|nr:hypothetical protein [Salmonella enterica subsp. arizonae serovar 51:z4,z23:-]EHW6109601.1 hypothetical protein [Salmonella enterica]HAU3067282.1 hypothetical protein [Salmonella enterica subsp. arizonae]EIO1971366.1 hypothetical protein [Salmonella enterica]EJC2145018.1 hypothetical protein [Salmonella enterica]